MFKSVNRVEGGGGHRLNGSWALCWCLKIIQNPQVLKSSTILLYNAYSGRRLYSRQEQSNSPHLLPTNTGQAACRVL